MLSLERYRTLAEDAATRLADLPGVHVVQADALAPALPDGGFDRILVNGCVEAVPEHWLAPWNRADASSPADRGRPLPPRLRRSGRHSGHWPPIRLAALVPGWHGCSESPGFPKGRALWRVQGSALRPPYRIAREARHKRHTRRQRGRSTAVLSGS